MTAPTISAEVRKVLSHGGLTDAQRLAAITRITREIVIGMAVEVDAEIDQLEDPDGDVRVLLSIGNWEDTVYIPVTSVR
jgi:hypothetical protein